MIVNRFLSKIANDLQKNIIWIYELLFEYYNKIHHPTSHALDCPYSILILGNNARDTLPIFSTILAWTQNP